MRRGSWLLIGDMKQKQHEHRQKPVRRKGVLHSKCELAGRTERASWQILLNADRARQFLQHRKLWEPWWSPSQDLLWRAVMKTGKDELKRRKIIRNRNSSVKTLDKVQARPSPATKGKKTIKTMLGVVLIRDLFQRCKQWMQLVKDTD